jgi:uncharacterized protein YbaP (TraB family)
MAGRDRRHIRSPRSALLAVAALVCACAAARAGDECRGRDLFPLLRTQDPAAFAAIEAEAGAMPFSQGTLFRLSREDAPPSYVFGTLHLSDPRVVAFRPAVVAALEGSKTLAVESVETGERLTQSIRRHPAALLAPSDQRAASLLDAPEFAELEAMVTKAGLTASFANALKPPILALLLDLPACARADAANPTADARIAEMARTRGLALIGLETMIEQTGILDGLSPETGRALLIATLRQASYAEDVVESTIARYAGQDTGVLLAWMRSPSLIPGVAAARTPPEFLDRLIGRRNQRFRQRLLPLLAKGGVFVAVGAAHLPGAQGLLRLLEESGYTVERVD